MYDVFCTSGAGEAKTGLMHNREGGSYLDEDLFLFNKRVFCRLGGGGRDKGGVGPWEGWWGLVGRINILPTVVFAPLQMIACISSGDDGKSMRGGGGGSGIRSGCSGRG